MAKGRKTGGRQKGARNVATAGIKALLAEVLSDGELKRRWKKWLGHRDQHIAFEAFKLALFYLYGKPIQPLVDEEPAPPIRIDISAIPFRRERVDGNKPLSANQGPR
jgi:hypothetical protein